MSQYPVTNENHNDDLSINQFENPYERLEVKNVPNTQNEPRPKGYNPTLSYWCEKAGKKVSSCVAIDPHKKADGSDVDVNDLVGAHVRVPGMTCKDDEAWIVPLCKHCNSENRKEQVLLPRGVVLVPIKMSKKYPQA